MAEYHSDFWVVVGTTAPVLSLYLVAGYVQRGRKVAARNAAAARRLAGSAPSPAAMAAGTALGVLIDLGLLALALASALISLATDSDAVSPTLAIVALLFPTARSVLGLAYVMARRSFEAAKAVDRPMPGRADGAKSK